MIKSYLINLDRDVKRLDFMLSNFRRLGIEVERFAAVDARSFPDAVYRQFMAERPRGGKPWLRGQMGCFLSHYAIWQKIAQGTDRFYAVFEDDVHIADGLSEVLAEVASIPDDIDLIRLDTSTNRIKLRRYNLQLNKRNLYKVGSTSWCTGGYIIHRRAAQRLLDLPVVHHQPVDVLMFNYEESVIAPSFLVLQCLPAVCVQDKHRADLVQLGSNIETEEPLYQPPSFRRLISSLYQFLYHTALGYRRVRFK